MSMPGVCHAVDRKNENAPFALYAVMDTLSSLNLKQELL
jgi:hypothetical protein